MEPFRADLAHHRLQLLVPALFDKTLATGRLRLERGTIRRDFYLRDGFVVGASSTDPNEHLAQVLAGLGILDMTRSADAFSAAKDQKMALGEYLVTFGHVDRARLIEALEEKTREAFFDCYEWVSGEVEFKPHVSSPGGEELRLLLGPLHRDALARLREWAEFRRAFPSDDVRVALNQPLPKDLTADERVLCTQALANVTVGWLLTHGPGSRIINARSLQKLHRKGVLATGERATNPFGLVCELEAAMESFKNLLAAEQYESAVQLADTLLAHGPLPRAHELYLAAERGLLEQIEREIGELETTVEVRPLPRQLPNSLTADELYLYSRLRGAHSAKDALHQAGMDIGAAYRSFRKLRDAGLIVPRGPATG